MAIRIIRTDGDPILRKKSKIVTKFDDKLYELIDDMIDSEVDAIYTINGIRVSETTAPGIYIVRLANGKHKKIIVK